nr:hypothetical protein GCM10020092_032610 [Actinoplanes digitatis]
MVVDGEAWWLTTGFVLSATSSALFRLCTTATGGTGNWPTFDNIDRQLDRGRWPLDAGKVLRDIPDSILIPSPFAATNPDQPLKLKLEGIAACKGSDEDVSLFLDREPPPRPRKPQLTYPA